MPQSYAFVSFNRNAAWPALPLKSGIPDPNTTGFTFTVTPSTSPALIS